MAHTNRPSDPLLEHARFENRRLEGSDRLQRTCTYPWAAVAAHVPSYRTHALTQLARMGAERPISRSQCPNETLNAVGRLFSESQLSQIASPQSYPVVEEARELPTETRRHRSYIAGIDLAGDDEEAEDAILRALQPQRDSTAVTIAHVTWETTPVPSTNWARLPEWEVKAIAPMPAGAARRKHRELFPKLIDLLKNVWRCQSITVDATGIGAGIASFLVGGLGADLVHPFVFSAVSKSDLGYQLLSAVNSGRLKITPSNPLPPAGGGAPEHAAAL